MILKFLNRLKHIFKLIINTPNYLYIILLNFISAALTFVGIPLLIPALEFLKTDIPSERNLEYFVYVEKVFLYFNIDPNFYSILLVAAFFLLTGQLLLVITELFNKYIQLKLITKLTTELITRYYNTNWSWIAKDQSGRFHSAIGREASSASEIHLSSLRIFTSFIQTVIYVILAFYLSGALTSWIILCFFIIFIVNIKYAEKISKISSSYNNAFISLTSQINGLIQNKKFFKASQNYKSFMTAISKQIKNVYKINWHLTFLQSSLRTFTIMAGTAFILLIFLSHSFLKVEFTELLVILFIFARLGPQFNGLVDNYNRIAERTPVYESVMTRVRELKENVEKFGKEKFVSGKITKFENVSCSYVKNQPVLENINIDILPFKTTAIIGSSGAGKSTFLDLFLGLLNPDGGRIFYGKISHDELDKNSLREKVAYVGQETTLLDGSLKYNLKISNNSASDNFIFDMCRKAKIDEFIKQLPNGLETQIGENGIKLSGGQRQRIALARALMSNPEILILDEATSQLDVETEKYIKDAILNLRSRLTIIIVAHRLSTVKFADNLYVLEKGKVVESGTFNDLLEKKGRLAQLESIQAL